MGSFADFYKEENAKIREEKRDEFEERIEKVFDFGGMMELKSIQLYDKKIITIKRAQMNEDGIGVSYNYFEDNFWEPAGYDRKKQEVWSNKIGWSCFSRIILAAHALEEMYIDGTAFTLYNGKIVLNGAYIGWINYLFNEKYHIKNYDIWNAFEFMHYDKNLDEKIGEWYWHGMKNIAYISGCEVCAILEGVQEALDRFSDFQNNIEERLIHEKMQMLIEGIEILKLYMESMAEDKELNVWKIMEWIRRFYKGEELIEFEEGLKRRVEFLLTVIDATDAPALCTKILAEKYEKDFWDLWETVKDVVSRKSENEYYLIPYQTEDFLNISKDDMIPWWSENCNWEVSDELQLWFDEWKSLYDELMHQEYEERNWLEYIIQLLKYADDNYYQIYAFNNFWEETLSNLQDKKYMSLWKVFESMVYDPKMKEAGEVIFVPEGPEYENKGIHYWEETSKRRLKRTWDITPHNEKNNMARVKLRRYMALLGNTQLRKCVFGF